MSNYNQRYEILEKAEIVDEELWRRRLSIFIKNFVIKEKRHRWHHLCLEKPGKAKDNAHKIHNDLIWSFCSKLNYESEMALTKRKSKGIYYAFSSEAWWLSPSDAFLIGHGYESLFFIDEGNVAVYFWHEMEEYLCKK